MVLPKLEIMWQLLRAGTTIHEPRSQFEGRVLVKIVHETFNKTELVQQLIDDGANVNFARDYPPDYVRAG